MARLVLQWAEVALDQYLGLAPDQQALVDACLDALMEEPSGPASRYDPRSDTWTATDQEAAGVVVYTFRRDRPKLVVLRLIYL